MSAKASGADASGGADGARHRQHHDGSAGRAYTVEQKAAVLRIRKCSPTAYYEILGLEEKRAVVSDAEIKKAYRKLSLLTHPDKNGYEGADEAFKSVSRAFQILSDPDKKAKFDKFGGDPESRFGGGASAAGASPFSGFARSPGGAPGGGFYQEEMSPEELFRQFFGGGGFGGGPFGGMGFDTGPGFVFNLGGGPGIRVHQFGGARPRRRPTAAEQAAQAPSISSTLSSLLPLLFLFILPLLSSIFSGSSSTPAGPSVRFDGAVPPHTLQRTSARLNIPYWVNPADVDDLSGRKLKELDRTAEVRYMSHLNVECDIEQQRQARLMQDAQGWFFVDETKMKEARKMPKPSCTRLRDLGYGR
ncbi:putative J domain-containing protein [Diplodia seriata]|uniref:Putative J domain-containing protein n=1 Tax=Diplodia seriata TaxID=420778 RepID=A0A1S8B753_9PEZI|nr:putative J domain-containing protein [Diplodia seriata]